MADVWLKGRATNGLSLASTVRSHDNIPYSTRRHPPTRATSVRFAHPAETAIADLFDMFGIGWQYEPTTFPLITSDAGLPVQSFTPDFYLPEHGTYIEMTTMRQSLVTRKNRKFRLMRETYPEIDVRLLYRNDVELILNRSLFDAGQSLKIAGTLVACHDQIQRKAREIATHLMERRELPIDLVALGPGAVPFRAAIAACLEDLGRETSSSCLMVITGEASNDPTAFAFDEVTSVTGRPATRVLVADVVSTGLTAFAGMRWLGSHDCPVDEVVALLDRRSARLIEIPLAVPAINCPSTWIAGSGLGPEELATLPGLHVLAT